MDLVIVARALSGLAALGAAVLGLLAVWGSPRNLRARLLATFLFLISANQLAEAVRGGLPHGDARETLRRFAFVCAALDPFVLVLLTRTISGRAMKSWQTRVSGVASLALTIVGSVAPEPRGATSAPAAALTLFTAISYAYCFFVASTGGRSPSEPAARRLLIVSYALATIPVVGRLVEAAIYSGLPIPPDTTVSLTAQALARILLAATFGITIVLRRERHVRRDVAVAVGLGLVVPTVLAVSDFSTALALAGIGVQHPEIQAIGQALNAVRWIGFGGCLGFWLLRYDTFGLSPIVRRRAARLTVAMLTLAAGYALVVGFEATLGAGAPLRAIDLVLLAFVVALTQGFGQFVDSVASRLYGGPTANRVGEKGTQAPALRPGSTFQDRFHVDAFLGRGGQGNVFVATDRWLARRVVLKEVFWGQDGDEAMLLREARLASTVRHPSIIQVYDVIRLQASCILVQEYAADGTLGAYVQKHGKISVPRADDVLEQLADALKALHEAGVVHADLKPDNVLFDGERVKLADFGLATLSSKGSTAPLAHIAGGTFRYTAPEVLAGARPDAQADLYSLAALARDCLDVSPGSRASRILAQCAAEQRPASAAALSLA